MSTTFEENSHSFIIRIWLENREIRGMEPEMRAVIEHVQSGQRRYLRRLDEIEPYVASYLEVKDDDTKSPV